jgi:hypothetical protein
MAFHNAHPELPNPFLLAQQRRWYTPGYGMHTYAPTNQQGGYYGPPPPQYGTPEWLPAYQPAGAGAAGMNTAKTDPNQVFVAEQGQGAGSAGGQQQQQPQQQGRV